MKDRPNIKGWSNHPEIAGPMLGFLLSSLFWISLYILFFL